MKFKLVVLFCLNLSTIGLNAQTLNQLLEAYKNANHDTSRIDILIKCGQACGENSCDSAISYLKQANTILNNISTENISKNTQTSYEALNAKIQSELGARFKFIGQFPIAIEHYENALEYYKSINDNKNIARTIRILGSINYNLGNYNKAILLTKKSLNESIGIKDSTNISKCYSLLGLIHQYQSNYADAIDYFNKSASIDKQLNNKEGYAYCYINIALVYQFQGDYKSSIDNINKALLILEENKINDGYSLCYSLLADNYIELNNYEQAIDLYLKALKINEKKNDMDGISICYSNLAAVFSKQGYYDEALHYMEKALSIDERSGDQVFLSIDYQIIGDLFLKKGIIDSAISKFNKMLEINESMHNNSGIAESYFNIANVHQYKKDYRTSILYLQKALILFEEIKDRSEQGSCYKKIADNFYAMKNYTWAKHYYLKALAIFSKLGEKEKLAETNCSIAGLYLAQSEAPKHSSLEKIHKTYIDSTLHFSKIALSQAENINNLKVINVASNYMRKVYTKKNNCALANKYANIYIWSMDSLKSIENIKVLKDFEIKEREKQHEIASLQQSEEDLKRKRQKLITLIIFISLILTLSAVIIIMYLYLKKTKTHKLLIEQHEQINLQNELTESHMGLIHEQSKIIDDINNQHLSNRNYVTNVHKALLPNPLKFKDLFQDSFLLNLPKEKISGDFYFYFEINNQIIVVVGDCVGHDIMGAYMSSLCISFLNGIVLKNKIVKPKDIVQNLRNEIIRILDYELGNCSLGDKFDFSVINFNKETKTCTYAGINHTMYIMMDNELQDIKSGGSTFIMNEVNDAISETEVQLKENHVIYMFTDGYKAQFGGTENKKFGSLPFKKLLQNNSGKSLGEQHALLKSRFGHWKGDNGQTDDVLLLGLKI